MDTTKTMRRYLITITLGICIAEVIIYATKGRFSDIGTAFIDSIF